MDMILVKPHAWAIDKYKKLAWAEIAPSDNEPISGGGREGMLEVRVGAQW